MDGDSLTEENNGGLDPLDPIAGKTIGGKAPTVFFASIVSFIKFIAVVIVLDTIFFVAMFLGLIMLFVSDGTDVLIGKGILVAPGIGLAALLRAS